MILSSLEGVILEGDCFFLEQNASNEEKNIPNTAIMPPKPRMFASSCVRGTRGERRVRV